jgi:ribosomal protein S4
LYEAYQNNYKYRNLLKHSKKRFFFRKNFKFVYKVVTNEKEFRRRTKNIKIKHYLNRLKLRRFYGNISKRKFKQLFRESMLNSNFLGKSFICLLETRLDVLLYRTNFFKSIFSARQYIFHQGIYVNGILLYKPNFKIKLFDFVFVKNINYFYNKIKQKFDNKKIFGTFPAYLEVNYKLGCISLYKVPLVKEVPFPFFLNYKHIAYSFFK